MKTIKLTDKKGLTNTFEFEEMPQITVDGEVVVFESKKYVPKKGEILFSEWEVSFSKENNYCIGIYNIDNNTQSLLFAKLLFDPVGNTQELLFNSSISKKHFKRPATESERKTFFDALAAENKKFNFETMQIEELKYIPKVGDCVEYYVVPEKRGCIIVGEVVGGKVYSKGYIIGCNDKAIYKSIGRISDNATLIKITTDQLQEKYEALGYKYIFENDTVEKMRWKPKNKESFFYFDSELCIRSGSFVNSYTKIDLGNCFQTESECQEKIEQIKEILK